MPALPDKIVSIQVKLIAVRDNPFGRLTNKIAQLGLVAKLSLVAAQLGEGVKVAEIAGGILSALLQEGKEDNLLTLSVDLPVADLKSGYYAVIAPGTPGDIPTVLRLRKDGSIEDPRAPFSQKHTYAVLKIRARERRGAEAARATAWCGILQDGRRQIQRLASAGARERREINAIWLDTLERAERLAEEDRGFLMSEIKSIFQEATKEVRDLLQSPTILEASGDAAFPEELQRLVGVADAEDLDRAVAAYQQALARSQ